MWAGRTNTELGGIEANWLVPGKEGLAGEKA